MTAGQRIKAARKKAGLTQKELGLRLGVSFQSVAQWENDLRNPKYETLQRIAAALGADWTDLAPDSAITSELDNLPTDALIAEIKSRAKEDPNIVNELRKAAANMTMPSDEDLIKISEIDGIPVDFLLSQHGKSRLEKVRQFISTISQDGFLDFWETLHDMYLKARTEEQKPPETDE